MLARTSTSLLVLTGVLFGAAIGCGGKLAETDSAPGGGGAIASSPPSASTAVTPGISKPPTPRPTPQPSPPAQDAGAPSACFAEPPNPTQPSEIAPWLEGCVTAADCTIEIHATHCCQRPFGVGVSVALTASYAQCETSWGAADPCDCAGNPSGILAQDGTLVDSVAQMVVRCEPQASGPSLCRTSAP